MQPERYRVEDKFKLRSRQRPTPAPSASSSISLSSITMNRPGQQPQRPPNLGPAPNLGFRGPYQQAYGMPPRGVMPGYPSAMQNHRAAQGIVPQPSPGGFMPQRTVGNASAFNFGGSMQQQQQQAVAQQQQSSQQQQHLPQPPSLAQPPHSSVPPPTTPGGAGAPSVPLHIAQQQQQQQQPQHGGGNPSGNTAPGADVSLDPNDFPALGSGNTQNVAQGGASLQSSYATQAAPSSNSNGGNAGTTQSSREFGPDDFPALGGQNQAGNQQQQQGTPQSQESGSALGQHPPGLNNGFQHVEQAGAQAHRHNLLANALNQQGQRGLLAAYETEKRNFAKVNQNWPTPEAFQQIPNLANGTQLLLQKQQQAQQSATVGAGAPTSGQQLSGPPGVLQTSSYTQRQQQQQQQQSQPPPPPSSTASAYGDAMHVPGSSGPHGIPTTSSSNPSTNPTSSISNQSQVQPHPQTPAQQLIMSPADRWGLLGLLALIKGADPDTALLSFGADVGSMGLNVGQPGSIYQTLITPWSDAGAAATVEPDFHLPACYNVQPPPPGPTKAASFSDETLFFMFYSSPRDALQEVAAQELWNRNWRWHKELRYWLTKETGTPPSQKVPGGEVGTYTFWDPETWSKERKDMTVLYADLEEKAVPVFAPGPGLQASLGSGGASASAGAGTSASAAATAATAGMNVANVGGAGTGMVGVGVGGMRAGQGYGGMGVVAGMA